MGRIMGRISGKSSAKEPKEEGLGMVGKTGGAPGWREHKRREAARLKTALAGMCIAMAAAGGYWSYGRPQAKLAPTTITTAREQRLDDMARLARENPAAALGERASAAPPRPLGEVAPARVIAALSAMPSRAGIIEPAPGRFKEPTPTMAPVGAPDAGMMDKEEQRLGKRTLPVDAQGNATLPDGTKVAIIGARPAATPVFPKVSQQAAGLGEESAEPARKEHGVK